MEKKIRFHECSDIRDLVVAADRCDFDVSIQNGTQKVDAKSLFGVINLKMDQEMTVEYLGQDQQLETVLNKYVIV